MTVRRIGLAIVAALVAQTTLAWLVGSTRVNVDLPLVVVVMAALHGGPMTGFLTGAVAGCAQDWLSGGIVGAGGLSKSFAGLATGAVAMPFLTSGIVFQSLLIGFATIVHVWAFVAIYALMPEAGPAGSWAVILTQMAANVTAGLAVVSVGRYRTRLPGAGWFLRRRPRRIG